MYSREYDLYRVSSYRSIGAWKELWLLMQPIAILFCFPFGLLLFAHMNTGGAVTGWLLLRLAILVALATIGATVLLVGSKHPNSKVSGAVKLAPLVIVSGIFVF